MEKWTLLVLFLAGYVFSDVMGCVEQANVDKVNSIARELGAQASNLPPANFTDPTVSAIYGQVLRTLCTTYKPKLDEIARLVAMCPAIILLATDLHKINLFGKGFLELNSNFADLNEFCKCSPHLISAWTMAELKDRLTMTIPKGAYNNLTNVEAMCNSKLLPAAINDLNNGQKMCPKLWKEAGLSSSALISDIKRFIGTKCSAVVKDKLQCAISRSLTSEFVQCVKSIATTKVSSSNLLCSTSCCGQRACVKQYVDSSCGVLGRDIYIEAVNLERSDKFYLVSQSDCVKDSATTARISVTAALGISLLFLIL